MRTDEEKAKGCIKLFGILTENRKSVEPMIDNIIKFVNHGRRKITDKDTPKGLKTGMDVYDGTAGAAARLAADGIFGLVCSQSIHWFDFTLPGKINFPRTSGMRQWNGKRLDEYPEVKVWLDECEEVQYSAFLRSNFYDLTPEFIYDGLTIGTPTFIIEEDVSRGTIVFTLPHFRECYIAENQYGQVDTLYRKMKLDLKKLVQKFGKEKIGSLVTGFEQKYENNPYQELEVLHCVFPRTDFEPDVATAKNKAIASLWLLLEGAKNEKSKLIQESGYNDLPNVTWRWQKNSDEVYGRSQAWNAFIEIMLSQQQRKDNLIAGHKMVDPAMAEPEELKGRTNYNPGSRTYIPGGITKDRIPIPLLQNIQLPYGVEQLEDTRKAIKQYFYTDFFMALTQAAFNKVEMTATQAVGIQSELAALLGTRLGRLQGEALNPIQDRVFNIEYRAGRIPQPPDILLEFAGNPIEIDYQGPLSQSQKRLFKQQGIQAGTQFIADFANIYPQAIDIVDPDKIIVEGLDAMGFPATCFRDEGMVKKIRQTRQQQEEIQQGLEAIEQVGKTVPKLQKKSEEGSPLEAITG
jgi:hypothetical protein